MSSPAAGATDADRDAVARAFVWAVTQWPHLVHPPSRALRAVLTDVIESGPATAPLISAIGTAVDERVSPLEPRASRSASAEVQWARALLSHTTEVDPGGQAAPVPSGAHRRSRRRALLGVLGVAAVVGLVAIGVQTAAWIGQRSVVNRAEAALGESAQPGESPYLCGQVLLAEGSEWETVTSDSRKIAVKPTRDPETALGDFVKELTSGCSQPTSTSEGDVTYEWGTIQQVDEGGQTFVVPVRPTGSAESFSLAVAARAVPDALVVGIARDPEVARQLVDEL